MWRVILSGAALAIDLLILLFAGLGFLAASRLPAGGGVTRAPRPHVHDPHAAIVGFTAVAVIFGLNVLAILFGARLPIGRKRRDDVAKVFD